MLLLDTVIVAQLEINYNLQPPGRPRTMWIYPAGPEIQQPLPEWNNWRGSELSTLETDVYVWHYALLVVLARHDDDDDELHNSKLFHERLMYLI